MAYFGLQFRGDAQPAGRARRPRRGVRAAPTGPATGTEPATSTRPATTDVVSIAYWDDPARFERWFAAHGDVLDSATRVRDGLGTFAEVCGPTVERYETLFSAARPAEGIAVLADGMSGMVQEHALLGRRARPHPAVADRRARAQRARRASWRDGGRVRMRAARGPVPDPLRPGLERHRRPTSAHVPARTSSRCCAPAWTSCATTAARSAASPTAT